MINVELKDLKEDKRYIIKYKRSDNIIDNEEDIISVEVTIKKIFNTFIKVKFQDTEYNINKNDIKEIRQIIY
jgi:hypothetical protein